MTRLTRTLATLLLMVGTAVGLLAAPAQAAVRPPAIWFAAHQDDETLSMGAAIRLSALSGRRNIVVLCTDGGASAVAARYPDRAAFVAERDREFRAAVTALGARPVISPRRAPDQGLTVRTAEAIMRPYLAAYPRAQFDTLSPAQQHPDHVALGVALVALHPRHARFFIKPSEWAAVPGRYTPPVDIRAALDAYRPVGWEIAGAAFRLQYPGARSKWQSLRAAAAEVGSTP